MDSVMMRFAFILLMSLALSSQAVALVESDQPGKDSVQKGRLAYEKGDYAIALKLFTSLVRRGYPVAQFNLAKMYREGKGVSKDYKTAVKWFHLSAEQGNALAQYHLSLLYYFGNGVPEDKKYAFMWANLASLSGFEMAQQLRQVLTEQMTASQIDEALLLIKKCKDKNFNGC